MVPAPWRDIQAGKVDPLVKALANERRMEVLTKQWAFYQRDEKEIARVKRAFRSAW